ncbi:MAG: hypothetical protein IKF90_20945 [Parasporobacterium sp.]|nr:hypothetical protein [Parasporobacterium sp.]
MIREILGVENVRLEQGSLLKKGLISPAVYEERMAELDQQFPDLDLMLDQYVKQLEVIDRDYSEKNPWIKLYTQIEMSPLEYVDWMVMERRIRQIRLTDASHMEIELEKLEYREPFPEEIFQSEVKAEG